MSDPSRYEKLSADQFQSVHLAGEQFEASLQQNRQVSIEAHLESAETSIRDALFAELLAIELEWQFARGQSPNIAEILSRFPKQHGTVERLFEQIAQESRQQLAPPDSSNAGLSSSSVRVDSAHFEQAGATVGSYKLLEVVGSGGMGSVWRAQQRHPVNREVAIKLIKMGMDTRQVVARFDAERQALAMMNHPNIANVLDAGSTDAGRPYFVMELVDGEPITEFCDAHQLTLEARLELFADVCDAVQHAHQKGVIHRDLKPTNVLVAGSKNKPIPKVIDFGLAKATGQKLTEETIFTAVGQMIGTPNCMSPEQAMLSNHDIDTRADVYALGVMLYELLAGVTPFDFHTTADSGYDTILRCIREEEPARMGPRLIAMGDPAFRIAENRAISFSHLQQRLRGDLDVIVRKALEKDRDRRYQSPAEMADDVQRYLHREVIEARPASVMYRLRKSAARNRVAVVFVTLLAASMVIGAAASVRQMIRATSAETEVAKQLVVQKRMTLAAEERTKLERWERYRSTMDAVSTAMAGSEDVYLARRNLDAAPAEHRGWEWSYFDSCLQDASLAVLDFDTNVLSYCPVFAVHPMRWQLAMHQPDGRAAMWEPDQRFKGIGATKYPNGASAVAYSDDGKRVAVADDDFVVHVWDTQTGMRLSRLVGHEQTVLKLAFHPDSSRIATGGFDHEVRVWDMETGKATSVREISSRCIALAYSRDGSRLMICSASRATSVFPDEDEILVEFKGAETDVAVATVSDDGRLLAAGTSDPENSVFVWDFHSGKLLATMRGHSNQITGLAFNTSGNRLASISLDQTSRLWDVKTGSPVHVFRGHTAQIYGLGFNPDGTRIVTGARDDTARIWDTQTGKQLNVFRGHKAEVPQVAFSQDGSKVVSASFDGTIRIWDARAEEATRLSGHDRYGYDVASHPFDDQIASVGWDGKILQWDLATGSQLGRGSHPADVVTSVAFDATGERMVTLSRRSNTNRDGRNLMIWDYNTGAVIHTIQLPGANWLDSRADVSRTVFPFSKDGKATEKGLVAVGNDDGDVFLFDLSTGSQQMVLNGHQKGILDVGFRPVGRADQSGSNSHLATCSKDLTIRIWDLTQQQEVAKLSGHESDINRVLYSPDGRTLASASSDKTVRLCDSDSHELLAELRHGTIVYGIAFSPDGTRLATACADKTIRLWDLSRYQEVAKLGGHQDYVHAVSFSHDGTRLVSASGDSTVRIWNTVSPKVLHDSIANADGR